MPANVLFLPHGQDLLLTSPYNEIFVAQLKATVPPAKRSFDRARKGWIISRDYAKAVADLCATYYGVRPEIPTTMTTNQPETRVFRLNYVGLCKRRDDGQVYALGNTDNGWDVSFNRSVLEAWFGEAIVEEDATLYDDLAIKVDADQSEIKSAYRRMARQWHPDVCAEPNARQMFEQIKAAYDILGDEIKRKRYDVGLALAAKPRRATRLYDSYRSPLRCGLVTALAVPVVGRWHVSRILAWDDIRDLSGRVMVASWDMDNDRIKTEWVQP